MMRAIIITMSISALLLTGCHASRAVFSEHPNEAAMQTASTFDIRVVDAEGALSTSTCYLCRRKAMEQSVADRFVQENAGLLGDGLRITPRYVENLLVLDVYGLPTLESAAVEQAFLDALAGTMAQFYRVKTIGFLFDGEALAELPNGTRCFIALDAAEYRTAKTE